MPIRKIPIEISFQDPKGRNHLEYPLYGNLIDYSGKVEAARPFLQLEPAFQFLKAGSDCDTYEFDLELPKGYEFTVTPTWRPLWREVGSGADGWLVEPVKSVILTDNNRCRVEVAPLNWAAPTNAVTLRFYCNTPGGRAQTTYGVSLTFARPAGSPARGGKVPRRSPDPADLEIVVNEFDPLLLFPKYDVFRYGALAGLPVSLEPAFRVMAGRPRARVQISLSPGLSKTFKMDTSTGDEVHVWHRDSPRKDDLSKVARDGSGQSIRFDYDPSGLPPRAYSILVDLEDPIVDQPGPMPGPLHVDPVLITDPPPAPVP